MFLRGDFGGGSSNGCGWVCVCEWLVLVIVVVVVVCGGAGLDHAGGAWDTIS